LDPEAEDIPYFKAIAEEQEKLLGLCKDNDTCRSAHFLRGLSALYENRELAALHFRKVVASRPNSTLAGESRFWLWFLDVMNTPNSAGLTSHELIKRLTREVVDNELSIHELSAQLGNASVDSLNKSVDNLNKEVTDKDEVIKKLNQALATLTNQLEQGKKEQVTRQEAQQALKASEKKVEELTNQLEALRRIDQEIREKVPPTRPSEKMTPSPEIVPPVESNGPVPQKNKP
jgi:DNA repair exonuclease SbcCD ATPase subunit